MGGGDLIQIHIYMMESNNFPEQSHRSPGEQRVLIYVYPVVGLPRKQYAGCMRHIPEYGFI